MAIHTSALSIILGHFITLAMIWILQSPAKFEYFGKSSESKEKKCFDVSCKKLVGNDESLFKKEINRFVAIRAHKRDSQ